MFEITMWTKRQNYYLFSVALWRFDYIRGIQSIKS